MELSQFNNLLIQVQSLNERYKNIDLLTGENFNVFRILKLESSEVRMHSAFIGELLNPKGTHGQKDVFLKLFINRFCFKQNIIDSANCKVEIEKHTGFINEDRTQGGRIDIIITDTKSNNHIIIENKIYAGDQLNQILRYYGHSSTADLLYLTLDGKEPSEESRGPLRLDIDFKCASYKSDIIQWLEECRKEVAIFPVIRESITQYINLIKHLTNQTINDNMKSELATIVTASKDSLEAAFILMGNLDEIRYSLLEKFKVDLQELALELNLNILFEFNFNERFNGVYFWREGWKHVSISFQLQRFSEAMIYGFLVEEPAENDPKNENPLRGIVPSNMKSTPYWPIHNDFDIHLRNWGNNKDTWLAVYDGTMKQIFKEKIQLLLNHLDSSNINLT